MSDKSGVGSKISLVAVFLIGMVCGVIVTAGMGGVAYWFAKTKPFVGEPPAAQKQRQIEMKLPRAFMQVEDNGSYDNFLLKDMVKEPVVPFKENGEYYWQAFVCKNAKCPGRKGGVDYVFAAVVQNGEVVGCPLCAEEFAKAPAEQKKDYEPHNFRRYYTPQAIEMIKAARKKAAEESAAAQQQAVNPQASQKVEDKKAE